MEIPATPEREYSDSEATGAAIAGLVDEYAGTLYRVAYSVLRNSADAEDAEGYFMPLWGRLCARARAFVGCVMIVRVRRLEQVDVTRLLLLLMTWHSPVGADVCAHLDALGGGPQCLLALADRGG